MSNIIHLPRQLRDAEVRASSYNEADRTIDVIWTTGATVRRVSWLDGPFDEELVVSPNTVRLDRLNAGAPLLDTHNQYGLANVLGSVVKGTARLAGGIGYATVRLSMADSAQDAVTKIIDGSVTNISVGYRIHAVEKKERDGQVPLNRVIDWEPLEISAVAIPADPGAQIRSSGDALYECRIVQDMENAKAIRLSRMRMAQRAIGINI
ncbi:phage head maturation protease [Agrobacterium vitis]|nr:phage head maturation protease [Agrobacterium vitis]MBE1437070.1 phage head maturation protease [Agrobacterium vitis]